MTGTFVGRVAIYQLAGHDGQWYCLLEPLAFLDVDEEYYEAPAGTLTDFASVPRAVWWIWPKQGKHSAATVIHDHLCTERTLPSPKVHGIYRRALRACLCSVWTIWGHWISVRLFGPKF